MSSVEVKLDPHAVPNRESFKYIYLRSVIQENRQIEIMLHIVLGLVR